MNTTTETQTATTLELLPDGTVPPAWVAEIYKDKPFVITREELAKQLATTFANLLQGVDLAEVRMATDSGKQTFLVVRHGHTWAANQWRRLNSKARLNSNASQAQTPTQTPPKHHDHHATHDG